MRKCRRPAARPGVCLKLDGRSKTVDAADRKQRLNLPAAALAHSRPIFRPIFVNVTKGHTREAWLPHRRSFALLRGCCRGHWRAALAAQLARQQSGTPARRPDAIRPDARALARQALPCGGTMRRTGASADRSLPPLRGKRMAKAFFPAPCVRPASSASAAAGRRSARARGQRGADRQAVQFFDTPRAFPARQWMVLIQGHGWRATSPACAGGAVWRGGLPLLSAAGPGTGWRRTCDACPGSLEAWEGRGARQPQPGACGAPQGALRAWRCAGPAVQGQGG